MRIADSAEKTRLTNGVRVLTERMDNVRSVSVGFWVDAGSRDEPDELAGVSHLIEHMIFKGTERRSALMIAKEIDAIGGFSNAFTSRETTCFHAKVLDNHLGEIVDLLTDIFLNSVFAPQELTREQEVVLQEIKMVEDTPDEHVHNLMPQLLWPDNPIGRPVAGRAESVAALDPGACKAYLQRAYNPHRIVIAASGRVDQDQLIELIEPAFNRLSATDGLPARQSPAPRPGDLIQERDLEQVHLCLGLPGVAATAQERYPAAILNVIFGGSMSSRLFQEVREKRGLAYSVYSYLASYRDSGLIAIYLGVEPKRTREALSVVLEVMGRMSDKGIEAEELAKAKEHLKGSIFLASESTDSRMSRMARNEYTFGRYVPYDEIAAKIEAVTVEEVAGVAGRILTPEQMALVALGPGLEDSLGETWYRK